jgi:hypothetical protein
VKTVINVNRHAIAANRKDGGARPVFSAKTYRDNRVGNSIVCSGPVRFIYSPDAPLKCGATAWAVTDGKVEVS